MHNFSDTIYRANQQANNAWVRARKEGARFIGVEFSEGRIIIRSPWGLMGVEAYKALVMPILNIGLEG